MNLCANCNGAIPDGQRVHNGWAACVASLAERMAALERWHPLQPWTPPAEKAEAAAVGTPMVYAYTCCDYHVDCKNAEKHERHFNQRDRYKPAEKAEARMCETCGVAAGEVCMDVTGGHPEAAPAVPKAEPARCDVCKRLGPAACSEHTLCVRCKSLVPRVNVTWMGTCRHGCSANPAPESTPDVQGPVSGGPKSRRFDVGPGFVRAKECPDCLHTRCGEGCNCDCDAARAEYEAASLRTEAEQLRAEVAQLRAAGSAGGSGQGEAVKRWRSFRPGQIGQFLTWLSDQDDPDVDTERDVMRAARDVLTEAAAAPAETNVKE